MKDHDQTQAALQAELDEVRARLAEAEETLRAIRGGDIDGLVVEADLEPRVYTLEGADVPYRHFVEEMQQGAVTMTADGAILFSNQSFAGFVGRPASDLISTRFQTLVAAKDREFFEALISEALTGKSAGLLAVRGAAQSDDVPVSVSMHVAKLGSDLDVVWVVITDLREHIRTQTLEEAEHEARQSWERERMLRAEAEADQRRKDEFLAMLAHELRNPLAPIRNMVAVLRRIGPTEARFERAREIIERQVVHMARLLDDLLDVSRITRGKIELRKQALDLQTIITEAVEATRGALESRRQQLTVTLPRGAVRTEADPVRLEQVIVNLLNNAAKFTDTGGLISLSAGLEGADVVIRVADNGIGIDSMVLPSIFDLFAQDTRSLDRSQGGLGIGLTIARGIVELHGGTITAHSDGPGMGSEFTIRLPALPVTPEHTPAQPVTAAEPPLRRLRILVVDDNEAVVESTAMLLKILGHEVDIAHNGPAALEVARSQRPDVVMLDIGLPGMDGYEVARQLRCEPSLQGTTLLAVSGYGQEHDKERSQAAGFDHHLTKPVVLEVLEDLLVAAQRAASAAHNASGRSGQE